MNLTDLSVIIVSYNVEHFLRRTIQSVYRAQQDLNLEVFVVDNASKDGSVEMVRSTFPQVKLIESDKNLGFAKANNLALKQASGKFLMLLNPDCILQEKTLTTLIQFLKDNPDAGAVGPKLLNRDGTFQATSKRSVPTPWVSFCKLSGLSKLFPKSRVFNRYELGYLDPDEVNEVEVLTGAAIMITREVYDKVGGLSEDYFMYGEDIDWSRAIANAGWKVFYVPTTQIVHYKGESTRQKGFDKEKHFYHAMRLYSRKHSRLGILARLFIEVGIIIGELAARLQKWIPAWLPAVLDAIIVFAVFILAFFIRFTYFSSVWGPPPVPISLGMWIVSAFYAIVITSILIVFGTYRSRSSQVLILIISVVVGSALVSTLAFFIKSIQFSRIVIAVSILAVPTLLVTWRFILSLIGGRRYSRKVLIVGIDRLGETVVERVKSGAIQGITPVGWLVHDTEKLGETVLDLPVLGRVSEFAYIAGEFDIEEALFSSGCATYEDIFRIVTKKPVKGMVIQIIPEGYDKNENIPLLELDLGVNIFKRFSRRHQPRIIMGKRDS